MTGMISKAIRGAATTAGVILDQQMKADIIAKRDARIEEYAANREQRGYEHTEGMQTERINAQAEEGRMDREQQQKIADRTHETDLAQLGLAQQQLDLSKSTTDINNQIKKLELQSVQDIKAIQDEYRTTTDPARKAMIETVLGYKDDNYLPIKEVDEHGSYTGSYIIFDKKSKTLFKPELGKGGGNTVYKSKEEVGEALKRGDIDRAEAEKQVQVFMQKTNSANSQARQPPDNITVGVNPAMGGAQVPRQGIINAASTASQASAKHPLPDNYKPANIGGEKAMEMIRNGALETWAKNGFDVKGWLQELIKTGELGAQERQQVSALLAKY